MNTEHLIALRDELREMMTDASTAGDYPKMERAMSGLNALSVLANVLGVDLPDRDA